jgi:UDP-N-acetylmuramoyl-tripeptide--D-alanyl-D-alanine ligase
MMSSVLYEKFKVSGKVSTDTRQVTPDSVFFALKGPRFNANEFAKEALEKGASCAVIDDQNFAVDDRYVVVEDTLLALQQIAKVHREHLSIPVIGLTGSNGKTTSKELLHAVLSKKFKTYATKGNLNNHIGVPLTILAIDSSIELAVIEMGANHLGEIATLCDIANPTHGFITNIGRAHIGTFGGYENIIRGKSELYQHLIRHDGTVFINSQDAVLTNMAKRFKFPHFYPAAGDYYHAAVMAGNPFLIVRAENGEEIQTQLTGKYNFENIAAALCIGKYFDVDPILGNKAIAEYAPGNMRSQIIKKGSNTIILDAYNANPSSMEAAIENLSSLAAENKVVILGDMFELEEEAEREHRLLGELLKKKKFDRVYLCGSLMKSAKAVLPSALHFEKKEDLIDSLKKNPLNNVTVLIKASRGIGLETVLDFI